MKGTNPRMVAALLVSAFFVFSDSACQVQADEAADGTSLVTIADVQVRLSDH